MQLALMGGPGSGKTTVGRHISDKFGIPYISSGDAARELAKADPTIAMSLKAGSMAPEEPMRGLINGYLNRAVKETGGFVIEGFPRTVAQYIALRIWGFMPVFVWLRVGDAECLDRLIARAREDDIPDAIAKRLSTFQTETMPVIKLLKENDQLEIIDGSMSADSVQAETEIKLERLFSE